MIAEVLRDAADRIDALLHRLAGRVDLHLALRAAAPTYQQGQAALQTLADHLHATGGDDGWLHRWAYTRRREEISSQLRAAADATEQAPAVSA